MKKILERVREFLETSSNVLQHAAIAGILAIAFGVAAMFEKKFIATSAILAALAVVLFLVHLYDEWQRSELRLRKLAFRKAFRCSLPGPFASPELREEVQQIVNDVITLEAFLLRGIYGAQQKLGTVKLMQVLYGEREKPDELAIVRVADFVKRVKCGEHSFYKLVGIAEREEFKTFEKWEPYTEGKLPTL